MRRLVVNEYGVFVGRKGDRFRIRRGEKKALEFAAGNVDQLILATRGASISVAALRLAAKYRVDVVVLDRRGVPRGRFVSWRRGAILVRRQQFSAYHDVRGAYLAKAFAYGKMRNQASLLRSLAKNRKHTNPGVADKLFGIANQIDSLIEKLPNLSIEDRADRVRAKVQNLEGMAGDLYWRGVAEVVPKEVGFSRRIKRFDGPPDAFNAALNYGYGVLASEVEQAIAFSGLDPFAGFLHADSPRRPALVFDLIEEFRQPVVDRAVIGLVQRMGSEFSSFASDEGLLTREARALLIKEVGNRLSTLVLFENRKIPIRGHIFVQARKIAGFLLGRLSTYHPFTPRW